MKVATNNLFSFRIVVRGTNNEGKRVRRVRHVQAADYAGADLALSKNGAEYSKGLKNVYANVLPPLIAA